MKSLGNIIGELLKSELEKEFERSPPRPNPGLRRSPKNLPEAFDFLALIQAWPTIVGERMARHTRPKQNKGGALTVLTSHPAYSEQLSQMSPKIIEMIVRHFPALQGKIKRIIFHTNSAFFAQEAQAQLTETKGPGPLPSKGRSALHSRSPEFQKLKGEADKLLEEIPEAAADPELRASLFSMYVQMHRSED